MLALPVFSTGDLPFVFDLCIALVSSAVSTLDDGLAVAVSGSGSADLLWVDVFWSHLEVPGIHFRWPHVAKAKVVLWQFREGVLVVLWVLSQESGHMGPKEGLPGQPRRHLHFWNRSTLHNYGPLVLSVHQPWFVGKERHVVLKTPCHPLLHDGVVVQPECRSVVLPHQENWLVHIACVLCALVLLFVPAMNVEVLALIKDLTSLKTLFPKSLVVKSFRCRLKVFRNYEGYHHN